tara:strand:- start:547 stop:1026 length:480 start_codon:yes stop_codon:yes gene_type:complete
MKYLKLLLLLILAACSGGAKGDKSDPPTIPTNQPAILTYYEPVGGYDSHVPLVQFIDYNTLTYKINEIVIINELVSTFSWVTFKASNFGSNLVGAMFINGDPNSDLYLWFKIQIGNTQETAEYKLNLMITPNSDLIRGWETIIIDNQLPSRIEVQFVRK